MPKKDYIILQMNYNLRKPNKTIIKTNAHKRAVTEILEAWIYGQIGKGQDNRKPNSRDKHQVEIKLDVSNDTFYTTSTTGNDSLTCGIVLDILDKLSEITITDLS